MLADTLDKNDIETYWDSSIKGIEETMILLDGFGAGTKKNLSLIPYKPILPLMAAVLINRDYKNQKVDIKSNIAQKLKEFFYFTALTSRYTEGTDNKLKDDYKTLLNWITSKKVPEMVKNGIMWNTNKYLGTTKQSAFGKAVLCLINSQHPKDFYENKLVGVGEYVENSQLHHIFPEAQYKKVVGDNIGSVFNFTFITNEANNFISNKKTKEYVDEIIVNRGVSKDSIKSNLLQHMIQNDCFEALYNEDYIGFISSRAEFIKSKFQEMGLVIADVKKEEIDEQVDDEDLVSDVE